MTDQPQQANPNEHRYYPEDEIELMDYLLVIWKWKYIIIAGTFAFALVAAIISFISWKQQPTMYRTSIVLKPGVLKIDAKGDKVFIDTPENIKALITNDLKYKISNDIRNSKNTNLSTSLDFQVDIPEGSNTINVSLESVSADEGTTKLNYLIKALFAEYANNVKSIQEGFEKNIEAKKYELDELSFKEKGIKAKTKKYQQELSEIESKIKLLQESKDNSQSKEYYLNKLSLENDYRNTFQIYFEVNENAKYNLYKIQKDIINVSKELEKLEKGKNNIQKGSNYGKRLSYIQKDIAINSKEIEQLAKKKQNIQNIQIIQPPVTTELPKTNKIKRNVALASVTGLFMMVFIAFFLEYLSKYKSSLKHKQPL
jgi:capsular polysaccharide biosynthesis protein